jgi:hypothetical protein
VTCHTKTLIPPVGAKYLGQDIPPLAGVSFMSRWGTQTTNELANRIKVAIGGFPPKDLNDKTYLSLTAYVLQANGARPGTLDLAPATSLVIQTVVPDPNSDRH